MAVKFPSNAGRILNDAQSRIDGAEKFKDLIKDEAIQDAINQLIQVCEKHQEFLDKLSNPMKEEEENYLYYIYGVSDVNSLLEKYPSMKEDYSGKSITLKGKFIIRTGMGKSGVFGGFIRLLKVL